MWHLDALSKRDGLDLAAEELPQVFEGFDVVWEQDGVVCGVPCDFDRPVTDPIINPMGTNLQSGCQLVGAQVAGDDVRMGQFFGMHEAVFTTNSANGRRQERAVLFATTFWSFLREFSPLEAALRERCLFG